MRLATLGITSGVVLGLLLDPRARTTTLGPILVVVLVGLALATMAAATARRPRPEDWLEEYSRHNN